MADKCKYADKCIIYNKVPKEVGQPKFLIHNVFCHRGIKGWNACKRYKMYKVNMVPSDDVLPGSSENIIEI